jgi:PLP dependent protein
MSYPSLPSRVAEVRERIAVACERAGRPPDAVTIVAVTKTHPAEAITAVRDAGLHDVGENRVQEMESKFATVGGGGLRWHLIGHLQRNKARKAVEICDMIHSVDSLRLARKLSSEAEDAGHRLEALIQVNVSGEETKGGIGGPSALDDIGEICSLPGLRITGLMTMAPYTEDERALREVFSATRRLSEAAGGIGGFEGRHLSMGMSNDFEIAVEEGSTLVRLGTVLLGERTE